MFRGGNQYALFLQAGGIAELRDVAAYGLHIKPIEVHPTKDNAGSGWRRYDAKLYRSTALQPNSLALSGHANCLFDWQVVLLTTDYTCLSNRKCCIFTTLRVPLSTKTAWA